VDLRRAKAFQTDEVPSEPEPEETPSIP
jgi:hypothetical protein